MAYAENFHGGHGRRKDFFQGGASRGFSQNFFQGGDKSGEIWLLPLEIEKLFLLIISESRGEPWHPCPSSDTHVGDFIQWHMVVICIWCALFVTSQFDVIFMFPNQLFGEVCWLNMRIFLHVLPLFCVFALTINYLRSKLDYRRKMNSTLQHSSSKLEKYQAAC